MAKKNEDAQVLKDATTETGAPVTEFLKDEKADSFESEFGASLTAGLDGESGDDMDFGLEGGEMNLSQIPILKLTQAMTPEVQDREYKDIYAGMFMNDSTKTPVGESLVVRVMRAWRCRAKFAPRGEGNNSIECTCPTYNSPEGDIGSEHGACATCVYNNFDAPERCQLQYHMVVATENDPHELFRIILSKTSYKASKKLENGLRALGSRFRNTPSFAFKVKISVGEETNTKINSKYYVYKVDVVPPVPGEALIPEELKEEFMESFKEVKRLRDNSVDYHKRMLANKAASENPEISNDSFSGMTTDVLNSFGIEDVDADHSDPKGENIPF